LKNLRLTILPCIHRRWGFANAEQIRRGSTGVNCRGAEHEVTLIWSITGGKQYVVEDGKEIHYSAGKRVGRFQHCWASHNGHTFTIIAHATPAIGKQSPGWKQFDLLVDGMSFDNLPHIYQLGLETRRGPQFRYHVPHVENRSDVNATRGTNGGDSYWNRSYEIDSPREMKTIASQSSGSKPKIFSSSPEGTTIEAVDLLSGQTPHEQVPDFFDAPFEVEMEPFHPSTESINFSPSPSQPYADISNRIMDAYEKSENSLPAFQGDLTSGINQIQDVRKFLQIQTSCSDSINQKSTDSPRGVSDFEEAMNNLVNLHDLANPVLKPYNGSRPSMVFDQERTLSELKNKPNCSESSKEIMKNVVSHNNNAVVMHHEAYQAYNDYSVPSGY
jgi:hypothetical protein